MDLNQRLVLQEILNLAVQDVENDIIYSLKDINKDKLDRLDLLSHLDVIQLVSNRIHARLSYNDPIKGSD